MSDKPAFGFEGLDEFTTKPKPIKTKSTTADTKAIDEAGVKLGFTPRNNSVERRKRKGVTKPVEQFNLRAHIEDINRFIEYAESENKSYREAFADLVENLAKD